MATIDMGSNSFRLEIGMLISPPHPHRHGTDPLTHAHAPGFSAAQQQRLANLVLG